MSALLAPVLKQRFFDVNGVPLAGGQLFSYIAGTTTPQSTYTDNTASVPNTNPTILDANGQANVWLGSGTYKFILEDANNAVQWTVDNVTLGSITGLSGPWVLYSVTDGQSATALTGATLDISVYTSCFYDVEIIRGTTVIANGQIAIQNLNGTGRVVTGTFMAGEAHGITWSVTQASTVVQLLAALSNGPGNGTIRLRQTVV